MSIIREPNRQNQMPAEEIVEWAKRFIKLKPCMCHRCFQDSSELLNIETLILFKQSLNELQTGEYELYILTLLQQAIHRILQPQDLREKIAR